MKHQRSNIGKLKWNKRPEASKCKINRKFLGLNAMLMVFEWMSLELYPAAGIWQGHFFGFLF
jgi:hypothetical protein